MRTALPITLPNGLLGGVLINRGCRAACSMSAFPHSDHAADMPDRSELGHERPTLRCPLDVRFSREQTFRYGLLSNSGSFAMLAANTAEP
jgi:hypothetical protein